MLSRERRINTALFKKVLDNGRGYYFIFFSVKVLKLSDQNESKFAFIAPKKNFKRAVQRVLLRRKGYNIINSEYENIKTAFAIMFFLKKGVEKLKFKDFKKEIMIALKEINILNSKT